MVKVVPMALAHHAEVLKLMQTSPDVVVREADSLESTRRYLARNPGISQVALNGGGAVVGVAMGGHDGRRGYLNHVLVHPALRGQGVARQLVEACLAALADEGIHKVHLDVLYDNARAKAFWQHMGWQLRDDLIRFSLINGAGANA